MLGFIKQVITTGNIPGALNHAMLKRKYTRMECHRTWWQQVQVVNLVPSTKFWSSAKHWDIRSPQHNIFGGKTAFMIANDDVKPFEEVMEQYGWSANKDRPFETGQGLNDAHQ